MVNARDDRFILLSVLDMRRWYVHDIDSLH